MIKQAEELTGIDYYIQVSDVELLHELVLRLPENPIIINIGSAFGTSALAMLECREDSFVFSIDIEACEDGWENLGEYKNRCAWVRGDSQDLIYPWNAHMVFVDGCHHRVCVTQDILHWRPKIVRGGIMAFHDYDAPICPAVKPTVDEMMVGYKVIAHEGKLKAFRV